MAPPEGLLIGRSSKPWKIGKKLGSGACGSVHELTAPSGTKSSSPAYAIKIAPLPKSKARVAGKKRKKTAQERNADLILHEYTTLQNAGEMRGKLVPEIPFMGDPPAYGDTADGNFRFLVMERMAAPISEVIPILLDSYGKTKGVAKIPLGDVAIAMLDCLQAMHDNGNIFIDVKPENFMLSSSTSAAAFSKRSSKKTSNDAVSQRVRLIDFGLVERYGDMSASAHRENTHPDAPLIGTPTYASLNIMTGHTASRRDDLESLGYVVSELILMLVSLGNNAGKRKKMDENILPWSHAVSDDELKQIKLQEMDKSKRSKSKLFTGLKTAGAATVMDNYFSAVRDLAYAEKPDYDSLRCHLKKLTVTAESRGDSGAKKASASPKKVSARRTSPRTHNKQEYEDSDDDSAMIEIVDENVENRKSSGKKQKVSTAKESAPRRSKRNSKSTPKQSRTMGTQTDEIEVINLDSSSDDENTMDWEKVAASDGEYDDTSDEAEGNCFLKLDIIEGPHQGQTISFGGGHPDTVWIGRDLESRAVKDATKFAVSRDNSASNVHAKLVINSKKNVHSVKVTDMSSSNGTEVNGRSLPKGKSRQSFIGDKIKIGQSIFHIKRA